MTRKEATRALKENLEVAVACPGRLKSPYLGRLMEKLTDDYFWFAGKSQNETFVGRVVPKELYFAGRG